MQSHATCDEGRPTLLLVVCDADLMRLMVRTLSAEYCVIEAEDGERALDHLRHLTPDLIVSDLELPKVSGEQLVHALRHMQALGSVPVLLLIASADEALRASILRSGAQDYLIKPFEPEELSARVHHLLKLRRVQVPLHLELERRQEGLEILIREVAEQKRKLEVALSQETAARELAEQANLEVAECLGLLSHGLRSPLSAIQLQLELLTRGLTESPSPEQSDVVVKIARSATRFLEMVEVLLQFAGIESERLVLNLTELDLVAVTSKVLEEFRERTTAKALTMRVDRTTAGARITSDEQLVRLVIANLCDNAIRHASGGEIVVAVDRGPGGAARLCIVTAPTGLPKAAEQQGEREAFEQLEVVRQKRSTAAFGLSIAKRIAAVLGAEVAFESTENFGSRFSISFMNSQPREHLKG
jgi:signal transduction histidine kinase